MASANPSVANGTAAPPAASTWGSNPANYRPLNVRDALSYLDQVKVSSPCDANPIIPSLCTVQVGYIH